MATVTLTVAQGDLGGLQVDEVLIEVDAISSREGTDVLWTLQKRLLTSVCPPQPGWDRYKNTFGTVAEPGALSVRIDELREFVTSNELCPSQPGEVKHWTHRRSLADATINGEAVKSMCGTYFVPVQDHESMPQCAECQQRYDAIPATMQAVETD
jgi:hypothetical protein